MAMPSSRTIPGLLNEMAQRHGDREVLVGDGRRWTYRTLLNDVRAFAKGLSALGVKRGSHVAILMGNKPEWIIADLAICSLGAVMVAVNTWVTTRELGYILKHADADTLIMSDRFLKYDYVAMLAELEPHAENLPALRRFIHAGKAGYPGSVAFASVFAAGRNVPDGTIDAAAASVHPMDVAYFLYTSGSTSTPKGVQLQHYALIENMYHIGERMHVTHQDRLWLAVSLYWGLGCENALFNLLTHGGCVVLQEHFDAGDALRIIETERCTVFYGTPNMAEAMTLHPDRPKRDLSSLRAGGTVGTPEQIKRVIDLGAREISQIYGLTETYGNCAVVDGRIDPPEQRLTSVGRPLDGVDLRIADPDTLASLPTGEAGEIQVKGYVTIGYYKDRERTQAAFTSDGYFRTGDLGFVDRDGFLYFRGRLKEMIKTGGINVAPAEVEEILMAHPDVELALVVGVPDPVRDEIVGAIVVPRPG
ncbi:MAG TPA: AMP-binding protein, partial [Rhodopila sp.]|nr:AMP-binding protein [Rhodopila sp.]